MNMNEMNENEHILQEMMDLTSINMPCVKLKEHYRIIRELGSGSYGHVLLAEHKDTGKSVALKLIKKTSTRKDSFLMEYCVSLCLSSHLNIIKTYAVIFETKRYFTFAQELAVGDLYSILEPEVGLNDSMVKRCAMQLAEAINFMHSKALVHRDVKLDNVLIFDKECHIIKLADFGLTRLEGFLISPMSGILPYSAPELCSLEDSENLSLDSSLDVWSFGILLFCISTGYFPWDTASIKDIQYDRFAVWQSSTDFTDIPTSWKQFTHQALDMLQKLLSINPDKRCPAIEVLKYLNVPWKISSITDNTNTVCNSNFLDASVDNADISLDKVNHACRSTEKSELLEKYSSHFSTSGRKEIDRSQIQC